MAAIRGFANDNSGLNEFNNKKWVVLIWVFADWCPVCHGEFRDLMKMKEEFEEINTQIFVIRIFSRRKILYLSIVSTYENVFVAC